MTQQGKPTSLADVIKRGLRSALADLHTAMPARVNKVNKEGNDIKSVDVEPLIKASYLDEDLRRQVEALPQINSVPIMVYGAGGFRATVPINEGDTGTIFFSEASLDVWLSKGGLVDPVYDHRCNLSDAMFLPGLRDFGHLWHVPSDRMTLGKDDGLQIHIAEHINIGSNIGAELTKTADGTAIKNYLDQLFAFLTGLTLPVSGGTAGPPTAGTVPTVPTIESSTINHKK